jgi:hypothetical protein
MKRMLCLLAVFLLLGDCAYGQQRDSLIVEGFTVLHGSSMVSARIWAVAFDSVFSYDIPLRWVAPGGGITLSHSIYYYPPVAWWDVNTDSINNDLQTVDLSGQCNIDTIPNTPFYIYNYRINIITLRFNISPDAPPQEITIDTTGPINFGYNPVFVSGRMRIIVIPAVDEDVTTPQNFSLSQNYPNPFNASTMIEFSLSKDEHVTLAIYDLLGRRIISLLNNGIEEGSYSVIWDGKDESGRDVPSGTYFYRLSTSEAVQSKRMTLIR